MLEGCNIATWIDNNIPQNIALTLCGYVILSTALLRELPNFKIFDCNFSALLTNDNRYLEQNSFYGIR